jgi:ankyrin repeat protein
MDTQRSSKSYLIIMSKSTPLFNAVQNGHAAVVELLLFDATIKGPTKFSNFSLYSRYYYLTPFHAAALNGHEAVVKVFFKSKIVVDLETERKETMVCKAAQGGHVDIVKLLLEAGAGVDEPSDLEATPLYYAIDGGYAATIETLLAHGAAIHVASLLDSPTKEPMTPLARAVDINQDIIVKVLLEAGADLMWTNSKGETIIQTVTVRFAVIGTSPQRFSILRMLLAAGVDINQPDLPGDTTLPQMLWLARGKADAIRFPLQHGADVHRLGHGSFLRPLPRCCARRL